MPDIQEIYKNNQGKLMAIVVEDVLYCGVCKPRGEPIEMTVLEE
jgi:capsid portal protein